MEALTVRVVGESISNVRSSGVCFDAGIRYKSGDKLNFGISLRNVGAPMRYAGDGLTVTATPQGTATSLTMLQRSERYELPSLVNIGFGYLVYDTRKHQCDTDWTIHLQFIHQRPIWRRSGAQSR